MPLSLTTADLARLERTTRTLLSPLAFDDADAWRYAAMHALCDALGARGGTFYLPNESRMIVAYGTSAPTVAQIRAYTEETWAGTGRSMDPILDEFHAALVQSQTSVWNMESADHALLGGQKRAWKSLFYCEVLEGIGADDSHGLFAPSMCGSAMLTAQDFRQDPSGDEHFPLLRALHPAFIAGLDALRRFVAHRAALDAVTEPLVVFDAGGRETHRNLALTQLLAADPEAARVEAALADLARRLRPLGFPLRGEASPPAPVTAEARTGRARYALSAVLLPPDGLGYGDAFLVSVAADGGAPALPTVAEARARHGLTEREAEVTLLVAQGLPNDAIAERLFVSRHTVRHHVENAMAKLELTGRGREAVAAKLLGADPVAA